jgi:hypothetical protein
MVLRILLDGMVATCLFSISTALDLLDLCIVLCLLCGMSFVYSLCTWASAYF